MVGIHTYTHTGGPWDIAAIVLVEEAGGIVRAIDGGPFVLHMGKGKSVSKEAKIALSSDDGHILCYGSLPFRAASSSLWQVT